MRTIEELNDWFDDYTENMGMSYERFFSDLTEAEKKVWIEENNISVYSVYRLEYQKIKEMPTHYPNDFKKVGELIDNCFIVSNQNDITKEFHNELMETPLKKEDIGKHYVYFFVDGQGNVMRRQGRNTTETALLLNVSTEHPHRQNSVELCNLNKGLGALTKYWGVMEVKFQEGSRN